MDNENLFWELIGKKVTGEATAAELRQLDHLIATEAELKQTAQKLEMLWGSGADIDPPSSRGPQMWAEFQKRLSADVDAEEAAEIILPPRRRFNFVKYATAACLLLAGAGWYFKGYHQNRLNLTPTIIATKGGKMKHFNLPDGTQIWLNGNSSLTYNSTFGEQLREVTLTGEAFFDVVKDKHHPFVVNTASMRLKVLGTAFNVRSFEQDRTAEAALLRGSIEVTLLSSPDKKIMLKPSEKIAVRNNRVSPTARIAGAARADSLTKVPLMVLSNVQFVKTDTSPVETQWMKHKLAFSAESFDELAPQMERYFNTRIVFEDESLKKITLSGTFQDESLEDAMKALKATGDFNFKITDKAVIVSK